MEVKVEKREKVTLIGMEIKTYGMMPKGAPHSILDLWDAFKEHINRIPNRVNQREAYGLTEFPSDWELGKRFFYTAGVAVSDTSEVPEDMVVKEIPEKEYAIVQLRGASHEIGKGFNFFYNEWLPQSGYQKADPFEYEFYSDDFDEDDPHTYLEVHFPVSKK
ncbi:GyrI-like domain-containing protein [Tenuibacillus multivorans]|uniref:AraC family transcriptional regulator n=1 Tax=Tenuibacillus multivorans TaxID=237069 RepID=A0A1H0AY57_9BACI|nr:GyrI-like domain-containing protein [Tenuibacillus multivorans]GEL77616.1 hypothetical protein TMU01_18510 [Tenuibacillus multivorans]SDN38367.1 AraC family transcriptional regulator [Tenuibacillus multivorans]